MIHCPYCKKIFMSPGLFLNHFEKCPDKLKKEVKLENNYALGVDMDVETIKRALNGKESGIFFTDKHSLGEYVILNRDQIIAYIKIQLEYLRGEMRLAMEIDDSVKSAWAHSSIIILEDVLTKAGEKIDG